MDNLTVFSNLRKSGLKTHTINSNVTRIETRMVYPGDGQIIHLYLINLGNEEYKLTDACHTVFLLSTLKYNFKMDELRSVANDKLYDFMTIDDDASLSMCIKIESLEEGILKLSNACVALTNRVLAQEY